MALLVLNQLFQQGWIFMGYNEYPLIVPIGCKRGCNGKNYPCISDIQSILTQGNIAFMIYTKHVLHKLRQMDCKIEIKKINGVSIGMYISEKGSKSVYGIFN
jgi:hypothetical protein